MKVYSLPIINKLPLHSTKSLPAPFPGRFPTHIFIRYADGTTYLGKPFQNLGLICYYSLDGGRSNPIKYLIEFDRCSKVFSWDNSCFDGVVKPNQRLFNLYHPMCGKLVFVGNPSCFWHNQPFNTLRGATPFYLPQMLKMSIEAATRGNRAAYEALLATPVKKKQPFPEFSGTIPPTNWYIGPEL